jgi:hypothetical protein
LGITPSNFKNIDAISESFDYNRDQDGNFSYSHSVEVSCAGNTNRLALAKFVALKLKQNNNISELEGLYGNDVNKLYEEKVDEIRSTYSFTENGNWSNNLNSQLKYFSKINHSSTLGISGILVIKESGDIVGFGSDKFGSASVGYNAEIASAKNRCQTIFNSYSTSAYHPFKDFQNSLVKNQDIAGGKISYSIEYSNDHSMHDGYIHKFTIDKTKRGRFYDVSESGTISGTPALGRFALALSQVSSILSQVKSRLLAELSGIHLITESRQYNEFDGVVSYSRKYSNDPDYIEREKIKRVSINISNQRSVNLNMAAGITGYKEIVQKLDVASISSKEIDIEMVVKKDASYKRDVLSLARNLVNENTPSEESYIESCEMTYDPFERNFKLKLKWNFVGQISPNGFSMVN